jgi:hypothetical protein
MNKRRGIAGFILFFMEIVASDALQTTAVGFYRNVGNNILPLGFYSTDAGANWSLTAVFPDPFNVIQNGAKNSALQSSSCNSSGLVCSAVGYYLTASNSYAPLSYYTTDGGASWIVAGLLTLPKDVSLSGLQNSQLMGVSCNGTGARCTAVGFYRNNHSSLAPLSYYSVNGGGSWLLSTSLPIPVNAAAQGLNTELNSVTCDNTGLICNAVGFYLTTASNIVPLSYTSDNGGASWSLSNPLPLPSNVASNGAQTSVLQGIACDTQGQVCNAIGYYRNTSNDVVPLSFTSKNGGVSWSLNAVLPLPADVVSNGVQQSFLSGIHCNNGGNQCVAVGYYLNMSNNFLPITYTTSNASLNWVLGTTLQLPIDVAGNGGRKSGLRGITCDSSGLYCSAVGYYLTQDNNLYPLSYTSTNRGLSWSLSNQLPLPLDVISFGGRQNVLTGVD